MQVEPGVTHSTWFRRPRSQAASVIGPASLARPICHLGKWSLARGLPLSLPLWHARDPVLGPHERVRVAPSMTAWCPLMLCPHFFHARRSVIRPHMLLRACSRAPEWCGRSGRWDGRLTVALGQDPPNDLPHPPQVAPAVTNPKAGGQEAPLLLADRPARCPARRLGARCTTRGQSPFTFTPRSASATRPPRPLRPRRAGCHRNGASARYGSGARQRPPQ